MLAAVTDYLRVWQLPLFLVFILGWIIGGGYLLHRSLREPLGRRKGSFSQGAVAMILTALAGGFAAGVAGLAYLSLVKPKGVSGAVPGAIVAVAVALSVAYLVLYAKFDLSAARTLRISATALGASVLLGALIAVGAFVPAYYQRQTEIRRDFSRAHLQSIQEFVDGFRKKHGRSPATPEERALRGIDRKYLRSAVKPEKEIGFFYFPPPIVVEKDGGRLLACDFRENHDGRGRAVIYVNSPVAEWMSEDEFQKDLAEPVNAEFAKALRTIEGQ